jgi:hypothetical protein
MGAKPGRQRKKSVLQRKGRTDLHDHVGWYFKDNVEGKEDGEAGRVLVGVEFEVDRETEQVGISDVGTVEEGEEVEEGKPWDNVVVAVGQQ